LIVLAEGHRHIPKVTPPAQQTKLGGPLNRPSSPGAMGTDFGAAGSRTSGVRRLLLGRIGHFAHYKADTENLFCQASGERQPVL